MSKFSSFEELDLSIGPKPTSYHDEILRRAFNKIKIKFRSFALPVPKKCTVINNVSHFPRNVRFAVTGLKKQTNTKWAIDLISQVPPKKVHQKVVSEY